MKELAFFLTLFLLSPSLWGQQKPLPNLVSIKYQIPEANTNAIATGPYGLMYVGGQGSLYVFAQKTRISLIPWQEITQASQNAFNNDVVLCNIGDYMLAADKDGLGKVNGKTFKADTIKSKIKVTHMVSIKSNEAYVLADSILYLFDGNELKLLPKAKWCAIASMGSRLVGVSKDGKNVFEIASNSNALNSLDLAKNEIIINLFSIDSQSIAVLTNQNRLLIYTFDGGKYKSIQLEKNWNVRAVKRLDNKIYVATLYDGLFTYNDNGKPAQKTEVLLKTESGKPLKYILSLEVTDDKVLFIGTRGGGMISYSPDREKVFVPFFPKINNVKEFHDYSIRSIFSFGKDSVYFGTDEGRVFLYRPSKNETMDTGIEVNKTDSRVQIRSLWVTEKYIYVGTGVTKGNLYRYKMNGQQSKNEPQIWSFEKQKQVSALLLDGNRMYVCTPEGLFAIDVNAKNTKLNTIIGGLEVRNIVKIGDQIYATGNHGCLWRIKGDSTITLHKHKFTEKDILYLANYDKDTFCAFTRGDFIIKIAIKGDTVTVIEEYDETNGLIGTDGAKADVVYGGFTDHKTIWGLTDKGLFCKREHDDFFYRFTPEIMGLPDNPDGNTGAFCKLGTDLFMGFRSGSVLVHTNSFNNYTIKNKYIVLEHHIDGSYEVKDSGDVISKTQNFSSIDLVPYDLENVFGGARPISVTGDSTSLLSSSKTFMITPSLFGKIVGITLLSKKEFFFGEEKIIVKFSDYPVFITGIVIVILGILILAIMYTRYKARDAKLEAEKLNAIRALMNKVLNRHFYKNNLSHLLQFNGLKTETQELNLFRAVLDKIDMPEKEKNNFIEKFKFWYNVDPTNHVKFWDFIQEFNSENPNSLIHSDKLYNCYCNLLSMLLNDKQNAIYAEKTSVGFFEQFLHGKDISVTIAEDMAFIKAFLTLYANRRDGKYPIDFDQSADISIIEPCPLNFEKVEIPRMLIQPLVENAVQKGALYATGTNSKYKISVKYAYLRENNFDFVCVSVENDGKWIKSETSSENSVRHSIEFIKTILDIVKGEFIYMGDNPDSLQNKPTVLVKIKIPIILL